MQFRHASRTLQRIDEDPRFSAKYSDAVVRAFRMRMQMIRDAENIQTFYALKSLHFEKLKGDRAHQYSIRLNRQFRLILELQETMDQTTVVVIGVEDYH
jgi:proteic killer suppression protein